MDSTPHYANKKKLDRRLVVIRDDGMMWRRETFLSPARSQTLIS
jgi:hypothetical protein